MAKTESKLEEQLQTVSDFFQRIMDRGMDGKAGAVWPLIIRIWGKGFNGQKYVYQYPATFFQNLMNVNFLHFSTNTKSERLKVLKILVDKLINNEIDIHLYHFGLYLLYPYAGARQKEEDAKAAGKKRSDFMDTLPRFELKNNDSFISEVWSDLIERRYPDVGKEIVRVPSFNEIRILFTPNQFGDHTGLYYSDADWLEPVPSYELKVKKWVGEKDPMTPQSKKEGLIEGSIILGHSGEGGLRHFVSGEPVYAGSYIEIKFGDGWISGRYEWSFEQGNPIRIHSSRHEWISIQEGHIVRIRG